MKRGRMKYCDKCGRRLHTWQEYKNEMCKECIQEVVDRFVRLCKSEDVADRVRSELRR